MRAPGLESYRELKRGLARICRTWGVEVPGGLGLDVCSCRDIGRGLEQEPATA